MLKYREIITVNFLKNKKRNWHKLYFIMLVEKYGWAIEKSLFAETNQDSTFSHTRENSKMFNITSKYFSFFNNKPPASWVAHITRDFLTYYSCSYYSSMFGRSLLFLFIHWLNYLTDYLTDYWTWLFACLLTSLIKFDYKLLLNCT